ncbi:MAG TPA: sigma-70 family RNA polymerase sigma factor [Chthoniobacteraceae bacterium]|nr:sigma-70 family RNA polymerase sigma factor [Chthoniobacteraceae bacterium]
MARIRQQDQRSLAALYQRHQPLLRTVIGRIVSHDHDVDDVLQECLLDIWKHAQNYSREKGEALAWIVTLARRRAIDRVRRLGTYHRCKERFRVVVENEAEGAHAGADEEAASNDRAQIIGHLMSKLPEAQREAVHLAFYKGLTQREIAKVTGKPLGTIKTRLELGLRKLRVAMVALGELHEEREHLAAA